MLHNISAVLMHATYQRTFLICFIFFQWVASALHSALILHGVVNIINFWKDALVDCSFHT